MKSFAAGSSQQALYILESVGRATTRHNQRYELND